VLFVSYLAAKNRFFAGICGLMRYELVIFDMDGTLTQELLDFAAIRREIGLPEKAPILESIARMPAKERRRAEEILHRYETSAAETCTMHEGAAEVLAALAARGIRTALLTRNSGASVRKVLGRHGLALDAVATREDVPHKPHRDSILNLTRRLGILPEQTLMVGDYLYDVQAAANAGVDSALLCVKAELPEFAAKATYVVRSLREVLVIATRELATDGRG
jgi:HAD superfamily hydrolase (TIGR01549 family)